VEGLLERALHEYSVDMDYYSSLFFRNINLQMGMDWEFW